MISFLVYLLVALVVLWGVKLIIDWTFPEPIRVVALLIAGLICLVVILQRLGFLGIGL